MRGINKVILIGHAGNYAEVNYMPSGGAAANVSLATSESWKDKASGEMKERTEWHRLSFMDRGNFRLGQIAGDYIKKGSKIYVEGSLRTREWEKDGVKRYTTEVIVSEMQLLDSRQDSQQEDQQKAPAQQSQGFKQTPEPQSFGDWGNTPKQPPVDDWEGAKVIGDAKENGATLDQVKNHPDIKGDYGKALSRGWVEDGVPF